MDLTTSRTNILGQVFFGDYWNMDEWTYNLREPVFMEGVPGGTVDFRNLNSDLRLTIPLIPTLSAMGLVRNTNINSRPAYFMANEPNPRRMATDPITIGNSIFDEIYVPRANQEHPSITIDPNDISNLSLGSRAYLFEQISLYLKTVTVTATPPSP